MSYERYMIPGTGNYLGFLYLFSCLFSWRLLPIMREEANRKHACTCIYMHMLFFTMRYSKAMRIEMTVGLLTAIKGSCVWVH